MKGKIIESEYIPGYTSWVCKQTKYGSFYGIAVLQEEDKDIDNSFDGCRIAEFKANLAACKEKAKWMRQRAIGAATIVNNLYDSLDEETWNKLNHQVEVSFREADKAKEYYERMRDYLPIFIENLLKRRRETRELIANKKDAD